MAPCGDASPFGTSNRSRSIAGASKGKAHGAWAWDARQAARTGGAGGAGLTSVPGFSVGSRSHSLRFTLPIAHSLQALLQVLSWGALTPPSLQPLPFRAWGPQCGASGAYAFSDPGPAPSRPHTAHLRAPPGGRAQGPAWR